MSVYILAVASQPVNPLAFVLVALVAVWLLPQVWHGLRVLWRLWRREKGRSSP